MCAWKKWPQAWKIRLIQEKSPSVDHYDAQWIPAFAGMTKKDQSPRSHGFSPFSRRRESIKMHPKSVFLRYFGLFFVLFWSGSLLCKVIRPISPKTCKFNTNNSTMFPYKSIYYCFICDGLFTNKRSYFLRSSRIIWRRKRKKSRIISPHSAWRTPPVTFTWWFM